jgi:arginine deiminase
MPIFNKEDGFLMEFAQKLIHNNGSQITVLDVLGEIKDNREIQESVRSIEQIAPNHIMMMQERIIKKEFLEQQDLMIISLESWKKLIDSHSPWLNNTPSVLIIKP